MVTGLDSLVVLRVLLATAFYRRPPHELPRFQEGRLITKLSEQPLGSGLRACETLISR
jgi:hypothetical protein